MSQTKGVVVMHAGFEYQTSLQYKVKHLTKKVKDLESGAAYKALEKKLKKQHDYYERELKKQNKKISQLHKEKKRLETIY